jgi:RNA-directed DNA polymerase
VRAKLKEIKQALWRNPHKPIPEQRRWLRRVLTGFFAYHAVPTNNRTIVAFHHHVTDLWRRALKRRGQKDPTTWADMTSLVAHWLPRPHIRHPWPNQRFAVKHPRWEPYAGKPHVRFYAGGAQ